MLSHHEAWDGSGYPEGLKGDAIHEYARVARLVNIYDTLTTKGSPNRPPHTPSMALQVMGEEMKRTFDPHFLDAFSAFMGFHKKVLEGTSNIIKTRLGNEMVISPAGKDFKIKEL